MRTCVGFLKKVQVTLLCFNDSKIRENMLNTQGKLLITNAYRKRTWFCWGIDLEIIENLTGNLYR